MHRFRRIRNAVFALAVCAAVLAPLMPPRVRDVFLLCAAYSIIALGLNVVTGYAGLLDLGIVVFAAVGAYTATILYDRPWMQFPGSFVVALAAGGLHAAAWGLVRGAPTLRLTGDYYAIVTFAFAEIARIFIRNEGWLTGGGNGFKNFPDLNLFGATLVGGSYQGLLKDRGSWLYPRGGQWHGGTAEFYYLCILLLALTVLVMARLERSRTGRAWLAIKSDEVSAASSGVPLAAYKMKAFAVSAFFAGLGGALIGFRSNIVSTNVFDFWLSVVVLCGVVSGGMGSIVGAIAGTFLIVGLGEVLREQIAVGGMVFRVDERARYLMFGLLLVFVMLFRAQGLFPRGRRAEREDAGTGDGGRLFHLGEG
jgi:branched-chain amino acid transport system permease protein